MRISALILTIALLVPVCQDATAQCVCFLDKLTASDGAPFDSFGRSVAIANGTITVGAIWDDDVGNDAGAAYIYRRGGVRWAELQKLTASDGTGGDTFGHAMAMDADWILSAALQHIHAGQSNGGVYAVARRKDWAETHELVAPQGEVGDGFGFSVAVSGGIAVIGALGDDDNGNNAGAAYVVRFDPGSGSWIDEAKLLAMDGAQFDSLGFSVAIHDDVIVVGSPGHAADCGQGPQSGSGAAYVFRYDADAACWRHEQKLVVSDCTAGHNIAWGVAAGDGVILLSTRTDAANGFDTGAAYVFRYDPVAGSWFQEQKLLASDGQQGDQFGRAVALAGDTVLIGAEFDNDVGPDYGSAYVFRFDGEAWAQHDKVLPDPGAWTPFFGRAVAVHGDIGVVSAHGENTQRGAVYVYGGLAGGDCNGNGMADGCDIAKGTSLDADGDGVPDECACPWDLDASGAVGAADLLALLAAWGSAPGGPPDFDGSGLVGTADLLALLANWGPCR